MMLKALVIEDDAVARQLLASSLRDMGLAVVEAECVETGRPRLREGVHLLFLDLELPGLSGDEFIDEMQHTHPEVPIVVVTADNSAQRAVETLRRGAHDYLAKPLEAVTLEAVVHRARSEARLRHEVHRLRRELGRREGLPGVVGNSAPMRAVYDRIRKAAPSRISVAFMGESGTGKELLARALHHESPRRSGPFVALNCAA
ncbi:MAG: response regulator, partial [Planctomycetota bacterium]|nr:response regulator [Planctomycetota bacterium]